MRLARSVLDDIAGLEIYAIIGILIFFTFFIFLVIWVIRMKKRKVEEYSRMPLESDEDDDFSGTEDETDIEKTNNK
ncbi:MAG: CcoQ/FixQ family Cbb3-type cytochrome c oxidase assembly chaperone [Bacteroidales bacterium]|nr:CcoQ/FixQ family Cbb3-type cytochrome c oxidase assembly chaperone [Bacteroidales bacterium]